MKRLACLHAHHSNITFIDQALKPYDVDLVHFVDPGLVLQGSEPLPEEQVREKIREQLRWMSRCTADAILLTCTQYIAAMTKEEERSVGIPVLKVDEPFFASLCEQPAPQHLVFTNPATVGGTMQRLADYAAALGRQQPRVSVHTIDSAFPLLMHNRKTEYDDAVRSALRELSGTSDKPISVAQLSMVTAAEQFEKETGIPVGHPLKSLGKAVEELLYDQKQG
jgi:Asp/Glu/hydantoin racemase